MIQFLWQILYNKLWYTSFSETSKEDRLAITAAAVVVVGGGVVVVVVVVVAVVTVVLVLVKIVVAVIRTLMNTIDEVCIIFLLQFRKLLIGGGIVQDVW